MKEELVVSGYAEDNFGDLRWFEIRPDGNGDFDVWCDDNYRDDLESITEFLDEVGGVYYATKADYKREEGKDLSLVILKEVIHKDR